MVWVYVSNNNLSVFYKKPDLLNLIELESLPEGEGILRRAEDGTFYYEPFPEPIEPEPTIEEKLTNLEQLIQTDNLTTFEVLATMYEELGVNTTTQFDVLATMYEEILALREEVALIKGGTGA